MFSRRTTARRSLPLRLLSLASALVLLLVGTADAYGLHRCAHHDALPGEAVPAGGAEHAAPGAHADHGAAQAPAAHDHGAPANEHDGGCTCVGDCSGPDAAPAAHEPPTAIAGRLSTLVAPAHGLAAIPQVAWLLPPINGPPFLT